MYLSLSVVCRSRSDFLHITQQQYYRLVPDEEDACSGPVWRRRGKVKWFAGRYVLCTTAIPHKKADSLRSFGSRSQHGSPVRKNGVCRIFSENNTDLSYPYSTSIIHTCAAPPTRSDCLWVESEPWATTTEFFYHVTPHTNAQQSAPGPV